MLDRRTMPLSALRAFESAGRHLHMGHAGEELGVTHGAISHQVRALERQLGMPLFIRSNNRLRLTAAGERLLEAVRDGFNRIVDEALQLDPDNLAGRLVIGCTESTGASWAVNRICAFQAQYPQVEVRVVEVQQRQKRISRDIDVAICYGRPDPGRRHVRQLATPFVYPVCSPQILHGTDPVTRPEHIGRLTLLHDGQNRWQDWFAAMGVENAESDRGIHFFSTNLALTASRLGHGVALCNPYEIQEDLRHGRLVQLLDKGMPETHSYYLLTHPPEQMPLRAKLFEEWIKSD